MKKFALIMRALPGAGKSTLSKLLKTIYMSVAIHTTDDFFMINGIYNFNPNLLGENHEKNFNNFVASLEDNISIVICDNTNISAWEAEKYINKSKLYGYETILVNFDPLDPKLHLDRCNLIPGKKLTIEIINNMLIKYQQNDIESFNVDKIFNIKNNNFENLLIYLNNNLSM